MLFLKVQELARSYCVDFRDPKLPTGLSLEVIDSINATFAAHMKNTIERNDVIRLFQKIGLSE